MDVKIEFEMDVQLEFEMDVKVEFEGCQIKVERLCGSLSSHRRVRMDVEIEFQWMSKSSSNEW